MAKGKVIFDKDKYLRDITKTIIRVLDKVGKKLEKMMKSNLVALKSYPAEWRAETVSMLDNVLVEQTDSLIRQAVGLVGADESSFFMIRAMVLEHGTGSRSDDGGTFGGGGAIAHWKGIPGLNDDIDGYNLSYKESYLLPDEFNMSGGHWFKDSCALIEEIFNDEVETMWNNFDFAKYIHS